MNWITVQINGWFLVALHEKVEDVTRMWSPEEDGLYVGEPPPYPQRKWMVAEQRLLLHSGRKWFRSDGSVAVLANPLSPYVNRNLLDTNPHATPQYVQVFRRSPLFSSAFLAFLGFIRRNKMAATKTAFQTPILKLELFFWKTIF